MTTPTASRTRLSPDELSIDLLVEEAGISRGHYFGGKQGLHEAVVQHAADELFAQTTPPECGEQLERVTASMEAYVDDVAAHREAYRSIVKAAAGGNEEMRRIYDTTFAALSDQLFTEDPTGEPIADTPAVRLLIRSWQAMVEELVLAWGDDPSPLSRDQLLRVIAGSLPALLATLP